MKYVYHRVPSNLKGHVLYPLNQLKEIDKELYEFNAKKYYGRELIMERKIPILGNCLWNDVVFLTAVNPTVLRNAYESTGYILKQTFRFFRFEVNSLNASALAVMKGEEKTIYEPFDLERFDEYTVIPESTRRYWRAQIALGQRPLLFQHIPHILYRGTLDTALATIVVA